MVGALRMVGSTLTAIAAGGDGWDSIDHWLMLLLDTLRLANWQRTKDGANNRQRPKPISPLLKDQTAGRVYGRTDKSPAEVMAILKTLGPVREGTS